MTNRRTRLLCGLALTSLAAAVIAALLPSSGALATHPAEPAPTSDYDRAVARLARRAELAERLADAQPESWMRRSTAARHRLDLAKLTGDYAEYARAEELAERAAALGERTTVPLLVRARVHHSVHRFDDALADIERVRVPAHLEPGIEAQLEALRADVALSRGDYGQARAMYEASLERDRGFGTLSRYAHLQSVTGDFEGADATFVEARERLASNDGRALAWLELQRGLLDLHRGRYAEALAHYRVADRAFDGWWLIEEHIAEALARLGREDEAIALYRDIVERTDNPEFMDALSELLAERDPEEARRLSDRARARYEEQLALLPEAAYGHALDHFLGSEDVDRALILAERNYALRPGGDAATALATARLLAGDPAGAAEVLEPVLASEHRSAETFAVAALAHRALGDAERTEALSARATAINPDAMEDVAWIEG